MEQESFWLQPPAAAGGGTARPLVTRLGVLTRGSTWSEEPMAVRVGIGDGLFPGCGNAVVPELAPRYTVRRSRVSATRPLNLQPGDPRRTLSQAGVAEAFPEGPGPVLSQVLMEQSPEGGRAGGHLEPDAWPGR